SPQVSRELAEISHSAGVWMIKRSSEFNPLVINGAAVTEKVLSGGDMIASGPFIVSVDLPQIMQAPPSPVSPLPSSGDEESEGATETLALDEDEATQALDAPLDDLSDDLDGD